MGVVRLPSVAAYWSVDKTLPEHFFTKDLSLWRCEMLWRCIHITGFDFDVGGEAGDPEIVEGSDDDEANSNVPEPDDERWFQKVGPLMDHFRGVIKSLMVPGSGLSVDEMMVRFFGRSGRTFRGTRSWL